MKTPREILLSQHRHAGPKLDAIRDEVVARINQQDAKAPSWISSFVSLCLSGPGKFWQELVFPSRRTWAGLATVWVLLAAINAAQRDGTPNHNASSAAATTSFREQQRLLNELFADSTPAATVEAIRPRTFSPKPRTQNFPLRTV
jgi:hypothetical protein